jgi:hypothetical protein
MHRSMRALAVAFLSLAACSTSPSSSPRVATPSVLGATQASANTAADPHALPELRKRMRRPLPWEPLERTMAEAREELFRAEDSGFYLGRTRHMEFGEILALDGNRVAVRFASIAVARAVERSGALFNAAGYKGEVEFFLREGRVWIGTCKVRRADSAAVVGDRVVVRRRNQHGR